MVNGVDPGSSPDGGVDDSESSGVDRMALFGGIRECGAEYALFDQRTSFRSVEQWLCWILNLISSLLSLLGTDRGSNVVNAICDPDVAKKAMARLTKACGVIIIGTGAVCNGLALGHSTDQPPLPSCYRASYSRAT